MHQRNKSYPTVSFIIPIYNSSELLPECLASILKQDYPSNKVEIVCPDGGSIDDGPEIAKRFGAKIINNPKRLAEPGFMLGVKKSSGSLVVFMGADNRLVETNWIKNIVKPFEDKRIMGAYSWHRNKGNNTWYTKYFNAFTDPINTFVLGDASNIRTFKFAFSVKRKNKDYVVYKFSEKKIPLLAFDQGFTVRNTYQRPKETEYDDILPVIDMIGKNMDLAFVPNASNYHFTLEKGFFQFSKKMRWIIDNNISSNPQFGLPTRKKYLKIDQKIKLYMWPLYAASVIGPLLHACIGYARDGRKEWSYHAPITYLMLGLVIYELVRVKLLGRKSLVDRY